MEGVPGKTITNEWVLARLNERLEEIREGLKASNKTEDADNLADDEDQAEAGEENDARTATREVLEGGEAEILGSIKWIEEHGDACAFGGCQNHVEEKRREADPASITCIEHRENEDDILKDLAMGL